MYFVRLGMDGSARTVEMVRLAQDHTKLEILLKIDLLLHYLIILIL